MKQIVVASLNPVKIQVALNGFRRLFPEEQIELSSVQVESGVSRQPMSDAETYQGALNRARAARGLVAQADYWIGIEGGVEEREGEMLAFAWIVVLDGKRSGHARSGAFVLPHPVVELIRAGKELGEADDIIFKRENSKQENGAIGLLTGDVVDRTALYEMAVILALVPFKNPELYG